MEAYNTFFLCAISFCLAFIFEPICVAAYFAGGYQFCFIMESSIAQGTFFVIFEECQHIVDNRFWSVSSPLAFSELLEVTALVYLKVEQV